MSYFSQSFHIQDESLYAHDAVLVFKLFMTTNLKIFQGLVSSCLFWRPGNWLIQTFFSSSNFASLTASLCFFNMALACSVSSLNLAIASSESFLVFNNMTVASSAEC